MLGERRSIRTWARVAAVVGALVLAWAIRPRETHQGQAPLPAPTATTPISADLPRILIADFEDRTESPHINRAPEADIYHSLLARVRADGLDLHVERLNEVANEFNAPYLGRTNDATLVVWGWYDDMHVQPYVEQIKAPPGRLSTLPFCALDDPPTQVPHLASFALGVHAYNQGQYAHALNYLGAIAEDYSCASIHNQRGLAHRALGDYDAALAAFSRAISLQPENAGFYANRGATFEAIEQYHAAHADFARAWELTRDLATVFN